MALTPNSVYYMNGVKVCEKIIPDGSKLKANRKLCGTGKAEWVSIHNTNDIDTAFDDGEQYTRATYNGNMKDVVVHFYTDDVGAWQNLKAGTGLCSADPVGSAEISYHSGDGITPTSGNVTSISIEVIMGDTADHDAKAKDNAARMAAWLLWRNGLGLDRLVSHTYWVNKKAGKVFTDVDEQCTNLIPGKKWCPTYIFGSSNHSIALKNWKAFKAEVQKYIDLLNSPDQIKPSTPSETSGFKYKKGDDVMFKGTIHFASANAKKGVSCKPGRAKITHDPVNGLHKYHCEATKDGGSTVFGWVNEGDLELYKNPTKPTAPASQPNPNSFLPTRGYFKPGDTSANIGKIASFMYKAFPLYTNKRALGNHFGPYLVSSIKEFQKRTGLEQDGCIGPITLAKLKEFGFTY